MKKLKIYEMTAFTLIMFLCGMMVFGYAMAGDLVTTGENTNTTIPGGTNYPAPTYLSPNANLVQKNVLEVKVLAPGATYANFFVMQPVGTTTTSVYASGTGTFPDGSGVFTFPQLNISTWTNGIYPIVTQLKYTNLTTNNYVTMDALHVKVENLNSTAYPIPPTTGYTTNNGETTVATKLSTTTGANSTTTTTKNEPVIDSAIILQNEVRLLEASGSATIGESIADLYQQKIEEEETKDLPVELKVAPEVTVLKAENAEVKMIDDTKGTVKLTGKAEPNQLVYLYIFSDPIVVSVRADSNGDWEYNLDKELASGEHKVYVAVKNDDNTIKAKSSALNFFVGRAVAASPTQNQDVKTTSSTSYLFYYIMFAVSLVTLIVSIIFFVLTKKKIKQHALQLQG